MLLVLYALFFFSGMAGLIYESIWTRYLALFVGHSAYAQILVLTIFLGGMAVGSLLIGRYSARLRAPLLGYAAIEAVVGVLGLVFHPTFKAVSGAAYDSIFPSLVASPSAQFAVKWLLAASLILPQSILLGATFPLISAGILRRWSLRPGEILSWLYASNSFGAAVGVLLAGFFLVNRFDFPGTLAFAAALNLIVAAVTLTLVGRRYELSSSSELRPSYEPTASSELTATAPLAKNTWWLLLGATFFTAVASFGYEIAWIRMLSLVLGSATHSFELMLSAFILGLALGALWVSGRADRWTNPVRALGWVQCAMGALAVATLPLYMASFTWISKFIEFFAKDSTGYTGFTIARYGICLVIMLPATFCAGMTLPLITRILYRNGAHESAIGLVYGANTAGSILGVQLAGLLLLPVLGLKFLLIAAAALDVALGLVLLNAALPTTARARQRSTLAVAALASILILLAASTVRFDTRLLASGVYRYGGIPAPGEFVTTFYRDGRTATVSVKHTDSGDVILSTNGKPDASVGPDWMAADPQATTRRPLRDDVATQVLLPLLSLAHAPNARSAAVIGQGSGMTSHLLLASPTLRELATIEIEPEMIRASHAFRAVNHRVFTDPRARFVIDDARSYFAGAGRRFDLIVSEPSNPWVSGVAGLFTTEFYSRIKRYLAPGGVFGQWMHLYEITDQLVLSVLAAVQQNFPAYDVYLAGNTDLIIIATTAPSVPTPDWRVTEWPLMSSDLHAVQALSESSLAALEIADWRTLSPLVSVVRANSDFAPVLDLTGEKARYLNTSGEGFENLNAAPFDITSALSGRRMALATDTGFLTDVPRLQMRARSARLRLFPGDTTASDTAYRAMQVRRHAFDALISSNAQPGDWDHWVTYLYQVDRDVHGGSPGSNDPKFYQPILRFLDRTNAPLAVREAVEFLKAADEWDFRLMQRLGDNLVQRQQNGERWLRPDYLRDATVVAHVKNGDPPGAMKVFRALRPFVPRDGVTYFRTRLLSSYTARELARASKRR
jgi:spermidine synthase